MSQPNYLNSVFNPGQARAIEKFVASFLADVLKSYEAGAIEAKPAKASKTAPKVEE